MKKGDYIVMAISFILIAVYAVFQYTYQEAGEYAEISVGRVVVQRIGLDRDGEYAVEGTTLKVLVQNGKVCVSSSDCPDRLCVESGWISRVGKCIVCLPQKTVIRIVGDGKVDVTVGGGVG